MKEVKTPINTYLPLIVSLFEKHKIKDAYLFGSAITDKFDEEKSDVDFLVNSERGVTIFLLRRRSIYHDRHR